MMVSVLFLFYTSEKASHTFLLAVVVEVLPKLSSLRGRPGPRPRGFLKLGLPFPLLPGDRFPGDLFGEVYMQ